MGEEGEGASLEFTPTWVLAAFCAVVVAFALAMERFLHFVGNVLKKKQQKPLFEVPLKVKEELMLLGFISLLLTVFQSAMSKICISREALTSMLPCKIEDNKETAEGSNATATTSHFQKYFAFTLSGGTRRLLAETSTSSHMGYCGKKDKLLLAVGTKLEHVITQLADEVAEKHVAIEGELVVQPSDEHFWFNKPRIVLFLIHFILFQNAFEIAFFFWIWVQFGFNSCIMGQVRYIIPRLVIGVFIQVLCSYSTLPLYAIVTQMGSSFKRAIFDEHVQVGLVGWAQKVKKKKALKVATEGAAQASTEERPSVAIQMGRVLRNAPAPEEIRPSQ